MAPYVPDPIVLLSALVVPVTVLPGTMSIKVEESYQTMCKLGLVKGLDYPLPEIY
jgi:hypothetical protein